MVTIIDISINDNLIRNGNYLFREMENWNGNLFEMELEIEMEMGRQEWNYNENLELVLNGNYLTFHFSFRLSYTS